MIKETTVQEYSVPQENLDALKSKLETINAKARKYGFPEYILVEGAITLVPHCIEDVTYNIPHVHITLQGSMIKLGEYEVVGMADVNSSENGNIIKSFREQTENVITFLSSCDDHCDHCNIKQRRYTIFVLLSEDGKLSQVGKSCLKLYTGIDGNALAAYAECLKTLHMSDYEDIEDMSRRQARNYLATEEYLSYVSSCIKKYGWIGKSKAEEEMKEATAITAIVELESKKSIDVTEENIQEARTAIAWIKELEVPTSNEYLSNVKNLCTSPSIHRKYIGYVASLFAAYGKAQEKIRKEATKVKSTHLKSEEKDKIDLTVTILKSTPFTSDFGMSNVTTAINEQGQIVKWFGGLIAKKDDTVHIAGTIKKFDYDMFLKEDVTLLTRVTEYKVKPVKVARVKKEKNNGLAPVTKTQPLQQQYPRF